MACFDVFPLSSHDGAWWHRFTLNEKFPRSLLRAFASFLVSHSKRKMFVRSFFFTFHPVVRLAIIHYYHVHYILPARGMLFQLRSVSVHSTFRSHLSKGGRTRARRSNIARRGGRQGPRIKDAPKSFVIVFN